MPGNPIRKPFRYTFFSASIILIIINTVVYILTLMFPRLQVYLGLNPALFVKYHMYWQPFTYMFIHGGLMHLLSNMLGLFFFGLTVERSLGSKEFLLMYFLSGIISGLLSLAIYVMTGKYFAVLIGASGALYAIMFAYAVIFPRANIYIWGILPIPSPLLVIIYAGIEFFSQFSGVSPNVAHSTHLLGFAVAWLYFAVRMGINPIKVWKNAYR